MAVSYEPKHNSKSKVPLTQPNEVRYEQDDSSEKYKVRAYTVGKSVHIYVGKGLGGTTGCDVDPPNFLERLVGITFESKIKKAIKKMQTVCYKHNKEEDYAKKTLSTIGGCQAKGNLNLSDPPIGGPGLPSKKPGNTIICENGRFRSLNDEWEKTNDEKTYEEWMKNNSS